MRHIALILAVFFVTVWSASAQQTIVGERLRIAGEAQMSGDVGHPDYITQLTNWMITEGGSGDFRYLFADELHAKAFIADLEQALAGGQIISKSVTVLASNFTNPAAGAAEDIFVKDLPSAENMAVFESGDTIRLRTFSRASGELTIADSYGVVTSYVDQAAGVQRWTFTRNTGADAGSMSAAAVVQVNSIVLDYGVSGNGFHEVNAIDGLYGINSPYSQIVTWATSPIAANLTVRSRLGNLRGITGVDGEYGLIAGAYAASNGQYIRASSSAVELHGVNLQMWDGATNVIKLDRTVPSFAIGTPIPSGYLTGGDGFWVGKDSGTYKLRIGNPTGNRLTWDGSGLELYGANLLIFEGATNVIKLDRSVPSLAIGETLPTGYLTGGDGFWVGRDGVGEYKLRIGDPTGNRMTWDGTTLAVVGSITATTGTIGGWTLSSTSLSGGNVTLDSGGNITVGTSNNVARLSSTDGTYRLWVGHAAAASAPFRVEADGTVIASDLTVTGGSADFGTVEIDSNGLEIDAGGSTSNRLRWTDGSYVTSDSDAMSLVAGTNILLTVGGDGVFVTSTYLRPVTNGLMLLGDSTHEWEKLFTEDARVSNLAGTGTRHVCADDDGDLVECP